MRTKEGIVENFGRIQRGDLKFAWKMKSWRGGGGEGRRAGERSRKSSKVIRGDQLNFTLFSPKSSPPQTINNDRSLRKNYGVRDVARFFVTGWGEGGEGIIASAKGTSEP